LDDGTLVLMRVEPPVDEAYLRATYLLDLAQADGAQVVDGPQGLRLANEKLFVVDPLGTLEASVDASVGLIVVLDGEILGAVLRVPAAPDFRIGPPVSQAPVTAREREVVARLAPSLQAHGLRCVGLDVIDGRLIEVNVTSPGALYIQRSATPQTRLPR
jgi:glutathione synthase